MIETERAAYPADMTRAADFPTMGVVEDMAHEMLDNVKQYAREHPVSFGLWALGVGFVLGWKLKPW
jgi:hypothetical protein